MDVCVNPICGEPNMLGIFAPVIYDEIGINLCTTVDLGVDVPGTCPTATNATVKVLDFTFDYGADGVQIEAITGRPNCYAVTLSNLTVQFAVNLYDAGCRLLDTIYPTAVYLPSDVTAETYDADTNPSSVELEIFAPYGLSYDTVGAAPSPIINVIGFTAANPWITQGINLFGMAKLLGFSSDDSTVTIGLTLVLQSLYYTGYKVRSAGKIEIPKGSIISPDNSDCMRFVAGELLNLSIKPLDLGEPFCEERFKKECCQKNGCNSCSGPCGNSVEDNTVVISEIVEKDAPIE